MARCRIVAPMPRRATAALLVLAGAGALLCSCTSSPVTSPAPTSATLDCTKVRAYQAQIAAAQSTMVDSGTTSGAQIAADARAIAKATTALGALSRQTLPSQTALWVATTNAYATQIAGGARNGTEVSRLLMDAHAFDSQAYERAAKAVGTFFSSSCPD